MSSLTQTSRLSQLPAALLSLINGAPVAVTAVTAPRPHALDAYLATHSEWGGLLGLAPRVSTATKDALVRELGIPVAPVPPPAPVAPVSGGAPAYRLVSPTTGRYPSYPVGEAVLLIRAINVGLKSDLTVGPEVPALDIPRGTRDATLAEVTRLLTGWGEELVADLADVTLAEGLEQWVAANFASAGSAPSDLTFDIAAVARAFGKPELASILGTLLGKGPATSSAAVSTTIKPGVVVIPQRSQGIFVAGQPILVVSYEDTRGRLVLVNNTITWAQPGYERYATVASAEEHRTHLTRVFGGILGVR